VTLYLVTGGCGFIGSHLADSLVADGHGVRILDDLSTGKRENAPAGAEIIIGDVADAATVTAAGAGVDGIFHLAAIASVQKSNDDWAGTHRVNLTGTINVFDAAREAAGGNPVPVVYVSSAAVYGDNPDVPLSEEAETRPLTAHGADKLGCELHARVAHQVHKVPVAGIRFFNIYGPRQDPASPYSGVISIFADRIGTQQAITIFGDGEQTRDFVYVGDAVRFMRAAMADPMTAPEVYNVCTGNQVTVNQLARLIGDITGCPPSIDYEPARPGDIRYSAGDPAKARDRLGIEAVISIEDGLRKTVESLTHL
jgi:UDP-glucose 4-epimerase